MNTVQNVNGQKAIRIKGKLVKETQHAFLVDCDGDEEWFPKKSVRFNPDETVDIQLWIYKEKFPHG